MPKTNEEFTPPITCYVIESWAYIPESRVDHEATYRNIHATTLSALTAEYLRMYLEAERINEIYKDEHTSFEEALEAAETFAIIAVPLY